MGENGAELGESKIEYNDKETDISFYSDDSFENVPFCIKIA
jgi:hypothetical protein